MSTRESKRLSIQYQGDPHSVALDSTVVISSDGTIVCVYDSISNTEDASSTGIVVLARLAKANSVVLWSEARGMYVVNPNISESDSLSDVVAAMIKAINNTRGWFATLSVEPQYTFAY